MAELTDIRETVRERYAKAATAAAHGAPDQARALESESGCCGPESLSTCCAPATKAECCGQDDAPGTCGCQSSATPASGQSG